ncbi:tRNA pseudouridine(55) synthase TruB [Lactococcus cremoris]|uniref:tRNA pseudouridine synthase B n=1 Tax=Lactococcus lactis subsp. cremoris TaxID=1359 RepID=A0A1V0PHP6_LACLC|nr:MULTISPECIES: tRNA pseudouridine(55) synthase TruB [Lactococcus]ARE18255.2 tRNA pseudouridine(55) synthase TruB [Lactococcus cremoris]ARE23371.2 tRNA pseudouridine(55) synthase TruB [Lactococcus cremoris]ARE25984.2 tRNA pseudouridine(55) synthase TruB [Lactococcus cremoris]ARE28578.2 tRNA pseudouridine(55) synthase TruB [Lactococcus cremoris]KZK11611.1 tRNA pseudouridine synthase B [Lactococcus cremoris]
MNGILNVYKEAGWTSFDVVAKLRCILKTKKIGHGGTLDPSVTGVLPIAVGKSTRLLEYMEAAGKIYEGQVTIGFSTETEDADGAIVNQTPVKNNLTESEIDSAMSRFVGKIKQIPPMYSAVKINGKKLYEYARAGQTIERPAREITIKSFVRTSPIDWNKEEGLVTFSFKVECSKGTYVRTLAVDLADSLGYAGHMSKLQRTASNGLLIKDAIKLSKIEEIQESGKLSTILYPAEYAVSDLPRVNLTTVQFDMARVGKKFAQSDWTNEVETADSSVNKTKQQEYLLTDLSLLTTEKFAAFYNDKLVAVYMKHPEKEGIWKPNKVLV